MTWMSVIVGLTAATYFASSVAFMLYLARFQAKLASAGYKLLWVGFVIHVIAVAHLYLLPESEAVVDHLVFQLGLGLVIAFLAVEKWIGGRIWASLLSPLATSVVLASLHLVFGQTNSTLPEFVAVVTPVHIGASILGLMAFLVAFSVSVMYVAQDYNLRNKKSLTMSRMPAQVSLDRLSIFALKLGFPLYTLGIVLGAVWAIKGDPPAFSFRYILAMLSWLVYGLVLLGRVTTGWSGRKSALMTMIGFLGAFSVLVGYFARGGA